jgi:nucleotide-binding universal stress UspA family protein
VIRYAADAARAVGATLSLIHIIHAGSSDSETQKPREEEEAARQRIAALQNAAGTDAPVSIVAGTVKEALLNAVQDSSADILVIGRTRSGALGQMGKLTYSLIRDSPRPVVSV